jgi:hypothetical protein
VSVVLVPKFLWLQLVINQHFKNQLSLLLVHFRLIYHVSFVALLSRTRATGGSDSDCFFLDC